MPYTAHAPLNPFPICCNIILHSSGDLQRRTYSCGNLKKKIVSVFENEKIRFLKGTMITENYSAEVCFGFQIWIEGCIWSFLKQL